MPESFDHILIRKFRSSIEQYEEPFNESAWDLMKQKLANKKKRRFFLLIDIAKAASVVLFIGISVLFPYKTNDQYASNYEIIEKIDKRYLTAKRSSAEMNRLISNEQKSTNKNNNIFIADNQTSDHQIEIFKESVNTIDSTIIVKEKNYVFLENTFNNTIDTSSLNNKEDTSEFIDKRPILGPDDSDFFVKKETDKKLNFGIALSSHYTSSNIEANDPINIGGGFSTEYTLSKTISVSSGIYVSNHNLNTNGTSIFSNLRQFDALDNANYYNSVDNADRNIELLGLDIPLNVNINFNKLIISTGVSSLVYLKERYTENYYVENTYEHYDPRTNTWEVLSLYDNVNTTHKSGAFKTFDFAKLFNLSIGYGIDLKKGRLIFQPFAKIPIGKLTTYDISYGYGGLALKYDF